MSGPIALIQVQDDRFLITVQMTTTFPPSAVLPSIYSTFPTSQIVAEHIDVQLDEKKHKLRFHLVGYTNSSSSSSSVLSSFVDRLKNVHVGSSVNIKEDLSCIQVEQETMKAILMFLHSSSPLRSELDSFLEYYTSHAFVSSSAHTQLHIYVQRKNLNKVVEIFRTFLANPQIYLKEEEDRLVQAIQQTNITETAAAPAAAAAAAAAASESKHAEEDEEDHSHEPDSRPVSALPTLSSATHWWLEASKVETLKKLAADNKGPLYVYNQAQVEKNISTLKTNLPSIKRIFYAIKANNNRDILKAIYNHGVGFECVSVEELRYVNSLFPMLTADRILFTPNFASRDEYQSAYEDHLAGFINLDNVWPLHEWPEVFAGREIFIRLDPGEGQGHHKHVQTGGVRSKFGVSVDQLKQSLDIIQKHNIKVIGLHVHKGSGIYDSNVWNKTALFLSTLCTNFPHLRYLDLGGGLGVKYRTTDPNLDLPSLEKSLATFLHSVNTDRQQHHLADIELWLEPGRFLVANAGVLLARVTQLKHKPGKDFVGVSAGMNSLIRPALYDSFHEIVNFSRLNPSLISGSLSPSDPSSSPLSVYTEETYPVDVVGPICETGDVLGYSRLLPKSTAEKDIILVDTAGAYGRVMSSDYNLRQPAEEIII